MHAQLYILSAPSGAGKTSLVSELLRRVPNIAVSISHTTRARRSGEIDGENYHFIDQETFNDMVDKNAFLEHAQVFDNHYGTALKSVETQLKAGTDVILEIDWQGARQIRSLLANAQSIFILPPSYQALEDRLRTRGEDDDSVVERRMRDAVAEMSHYNEYDYVIINDDFSEALAQIIAIVTANRTRTARQKLQMASLLRDLLHDESSI